MRAVDDATPDGSFVELIGVVEDAPRIRREPIGAGVFEPFASVRLRCRRQLRSGIGRSRAVFTSSTILPLEVPLSGMLAQAGVLLRPGNMVHIHGRLLHYRYQLPLRSTSTTGALTARAAGGAGRHCRQRSHSPGAAQAGLGHYGIRARGAPCAAALPDGDQADDRGWPRRAPARHGAQRCRDRRAGRGSGGRLPGSARRGLRRRCQILMRWLRSTCATLAAFPREQAEPPPPIVAPGRPRRRPRAEETALATSDELAGDDTQDAGDAAWRL